MPLSREERHTLAARLRLGEDQKPPIHQLDEIHHDFGSGVYQLVVGNMVGIWALGHTLCAYSLRNHNPIRWEDGTEWNGTGFWAESVLQYLERN